MPLIGLLINIGIGQSTLTPREQASFLKENLLPIKESGQLKFTEDEEIGIEGISTEYVYGHTESMMICDIDYKGQTISYGTQI